MAGGWSRWAPTTELIAESGLSDELFTIQASSYVDTA